MNAKMYGGRNWCFAGSCLCTSIMLAMALQLVSCGGDQIADELNKLFPPISSNDQRQKAIEGAATSLNSMTSPNVAAAVSLKDFENLIMSEDLRAQGVTSLEVSGSEQLIEARVRFEKLFTEADAASDPELLEFFKQWQPKISGRVTAYLGVVALPSGDSGTKMNLSLLPSVSRIQIEKVELRGTIDVSGIGTVMAGLLNKYRDNLTGFLTKQPFSTISLPSVAPAVQTLSDEVHIADGNSDVIVIIDSKSPGPVGRVGAIAWLVTDDIVATVLEVIPPGVVIPRDASIKVDPTFRAIKGQILGFLDESFGVKSLDVAPNWVAVRRDLIAMTANTLVNQASACASANGTAHHKTEAKIPMPSASAVDCTQRSCSDSRKCDFEASKDTRDCGTCILSRPVLCAPDFLGGGCTGGGCIQRGNDPICEAGKAAQNLAYNVQANAEKADCDRLKNQEILACQGEAVVEKTLCDVGRETLSVIKQASGNFANVDVTTDVSTSDLKLCITDFSLSPGLDRASLRLHGSGSATALVDVHFTPLDIVGHLVCSFPWSKSETFTAKMRDPVVPLMASVAVREEGGQAVMDFSVKETAVKLEISPSPTEYLVLKPSMMSVSCSGLNFISPLVVLLTPFIPTLRGEIDHQFPAQKVSLRVLLPQQEVNGVLLKTKLRSNKQALLLQASALKVE